MQIRELNLKELDLVYELISQLYTELSYDEFEDLVYDMREINYTMVGVLDSNELISYAGVAVLTTFKDKRHLKVFDFITSNKYDNLKYDKILKDYLDDFARFAMCKKVVF